MKPKVLADFLRKTIQIPVPTELRRHPNEQTLEVKVIDFIQKFMFQSFEDMQV